MLRVIRLLVPLAVLLAVTTHSLAAFAAPTQWESVDVTVHEEQQQSKLLVSGELPAATTLPADAELAVPAGTQLQWVGEILGGDPSKDPELTYTKSSVDGMDVYQFTLTKSRSAQVEATIPATTSFDGTNYLTALKWTAWTTVPEVRLSQRIPSASQIVQASPGAAVQPGPTGYSYYGKTFNSPQKGDVLDLAFSYALTAAPAPAAGGTASSGQSPSVLAPMIIVLIAVAGFGLAFFKVQQKLAAKAAHKSPVQLKAATSASHSRHAGTKAGMRGKTQSGPAVEPTAPRRVRTLVPVLAIVVVFAIGFAVAGAKGSMAVVAEGKITRSFGAASACQSASLPLTANPGVDLNKQGEQLLTAFEGMEGVGEVTLDVAQSKIDLAWCESSQSEDSMRGAMTSTGLVTVGAGAQTAASAPITAALDPSGSKQTVAIDTSSGSFSPGQVVLKAGVPAELAFGQAAGCLSEVIITDLGINQDLTGGPATVSLPALEAGTYQFACAMGHQSGQLVIQ